VQQLGLDLKDNVTLPTVLINDGRLLTGTSGPAAGTSSA
jgi:hypothetical protein